MNKNITTYNYMNLDTLKTMPEDILSKRHEELSVRKFRLHKIILEESNNIVKELYNTVYRCNKLSKIVLHNAEIVKELILIESLVNIESLLYEATTKRLKSPFAENDKEINLTNTENYCVSDLDILRDAYDGDMDAWNHANQ